MGRSSEDDENLRFAADRVEAVFLAGPIPDETPRGLVGAALPAGQFHPAISGRRGLRPEKWCTDSHLIRAFGPASSEGPDTRTATG